MFFHSKEMYYGWMVALLISVVKHKLSPPVPL